MNPTTGELQNISLKKNPVSDYVLNVADAQQLVHQPVLPGLVSENLIYLSNVVKMIRSDRVLRNACSVENVLLFVRAE